MHAVLAESHLVYDVEQPTTLLVNVMAASTSRQTIKFEDFRVDPVVDYRVLPVGEEQNRIVRLALNEPGRYEISYQAKILLDPFTARSPDVEETDYADLPPDVLSYLNPSRYCESDRLANFAMAEFGGMQRNFDRVDSICNWIDAQIEYLPGSTNSLTTASDVLIQRTGVCRDFAHMGISFCRALGIPARYVSGYACLLDPPDFHGFFEAYLSGQWYLFDPTRLAPPAGLVRIGTGRDAADVAFATIWGKAKLIHKEVLATAISSEDLEEKGKVVSTA